jgi:putative membrane protein
MTDEASKTAQAHAKLTKSAQHLEDSAEVQVDSADRRTQLAADRTVLAAERTYAAWVRTGLAALASGIGARALLEHLVPDWLGLATASLLVLFAGFCFLAAIWREMMRITPVSPDVHRLPPKLLMAINGFLLLVCLATLAGICSA